MDVPPQNGHYQLQRQFELYLLNQCITPLLCIFISVYYIHHLIFTYMYIDENNILEPYHTRVTIPTSQHIQRCPLSYVYIIVIILHKQD